MRAHPRAGRDLFPLVQGTGTVLRMLLLKPFLAALDHCLIPRSLFTVQNRFQPAVGSIIQRSHFL